MRGEDGFEQRIQATDDHPFFVVGKGWRTTIELLDGDLIETDGHGSMTVVSVIDEQRTDLTYNFTVDDFHTYYVTQKNVLVHNCGDEKVNTALYQKVDKDGNHLKFGIAKIPEKNRYTAKQMNGGKLKVLALGEKKEMLKLERNPHETLPLGPEEGQKFYIKKQVAKGLKPPPYGD